VNEYEVEEAAQRYALHPVLGPATRTLVNLVTWTNRNSDGWPYWSKPRQAAARLIALIGDRRDELDNPDRDDATVDTYKTALRPVKAFRTKQAARLGQDRETLFEIIEPGPGVGGEVWVLSQIVADAEREWEQARDRLAAARELLDRARADLTAAQSRRNLADARTALAAGELSPTADLARLAAFDLGDRLWIMPPGLDPDLGEPATVTGLSYRMAGAVLTYVTDDGRHGEAYRPMGLDDARARSWILDADRTRIVAVGFDDEQRTARVQAERFPGCVVAAGASFIPGGIDRDAVRSGDTVTYAAQPGAGVFTGTVEYTTAEHVHVITDAYRYGIAWRRILTHTPRDTDALAALAGEDA
jgi:hypothetical protein